MRKNNEKFQTIEKPYNSFYYTVNHEKIINKLQHFDKKR